MYNSNDIGIPTLFDQIPQYNQIIHDLSRGNLKGGNDLKLKKSKLCHSLHDLLNLIENNKTPINNNNKLDDELSYFILFMDNNKLTNFIKLLLDLNNFKNAFITKKQDLKTNCVRCNSDKNNLNFKNFNLNNKNNFNEIDDDFELNDIINENDEDCICSVEYNKALAEDALAIFKKYISKDAPYSINANDELISNTISNICPEDGKFIILSCFDDVKKYVYEYIEKHYFEKYLNSEYRCKYLLYILKNRSLELVDILYDDYAIVYFLEYLEQEKVSDLLKFWIQAENFSQNVLNIKKSLDEDLNKKNKISYENLFKQIQNDAMIVYDNYISLQAKNPIGFDKHVRLQIELNICQNIDNNNCEPNYLFNVYADCFYLPLLIVYNILDKIYFNNFLSSKLYNKYVNELLANSSSNNSNTNENNANVLSTSTNNTNKVKDKEPLLVKYNKKTYQLEFNNLLIKTNNSSSNTSLNNNYSNSNRDSFNSIKNENILPNKIQIGRIDSLGRYIRQIEDEPELSNEKKKPFNKLINIFNKNNSSHKNKKYIFSSTDVNDDEEEMALKAAEMLINDVVGNKLNS